MRPLPIVMTALLVVAFLSFSGVAVADTTSEEPPCHAQFDEEQLSQFPLETPPDGVFNALLINECIDPDDVPDS